MSNKETNQGEHDQLENVQQALNQTEQFIEKHKNQLLAGVAIVVLVVSGFFAFQHFHLVPQERKAEAAMYQAQLAFEKDSFQLALNGNVEFDGFETIISDFGMTKSANLATAYAGVAYFQLKNYEKAAQYLKDVDANDQMIAPALIGLIGDCHVEMGNIKGAISHFEKAANKANNDLLSPTYLKKAGVAYYELGDFKASEKAFAKVKEQFPNSVEALDIEKYIEKAKLSVK